MACELVQCCTTLADDTICYVDEDWTNQFGRVVKLDMDGIVDWTYNGNSVVNAEKNFRPVEIVTTNLNNVVVSDTVLCLLNAPSLLNAPPLFICYKKMCFL